MNTISGCNKIIGMHKGKINFQGNFNDFKNKNKNII